MKNSSPDGGYRVGHLTAIWLTLRISVLLHTPFDFRANHIFCWIWDTPSPGGSVAQYSADPSAENPILLCSKPLVETIPGAKTSGIFPGGLNPKKELAGPCDLPTDEKRAIKTINESNFLIIQWLQTI